MLMSDLILNINFDESRKKGKIVLETYEGTIPKLKSKQYSGQLRNVNVNGLSVVNNLSGVELEMIKNFLNKDFNIQISKYQYMLSNSCIYELEMLVNMECLFQKEKKSPMFQVEYIEYGSEKEKKYYLLDGLKICGEKTGLFVVVDCDKINDRVQQIVPKAYIDIKKEKCPLILIFDYDNYLINYEDKERIIEGDNKYRNYGFEEQILNIVKSCGWEYHKAEGFVYSGKVLQNDVEELILNGITVFTNNDKEILSADFSDVHVSYNIDWFEIKGSVKIDGQSIDISELIDFRKKKENWVEINGKVIFIPKVFDRKLIKKDKKSEILKIEKKYLASAIEIAYGLGKSSVSGLENFVGYENIHLNLDSHINVLLRPYQIIGVKWLLSLRRNGFGGCLADDMGLGKTLQIIAYLSDASMNNTVNLIIVPKTLLLNWKYEFDKFLPETSLYIYHGVNREFECIKSKKVILTTFGTIMNDIELFNDLKFDNLIIDEAQYIKNSKTKVYCAIKRLDAETKLIMTGTPVENNIKEYWGLMRLINPDVLDNFTVLSKDLTPEEIVNKIRRMTAPFLLRRMKADVLKDLPIKQEQILYCKMETEQQDLYNKMLESIRYEITRKNDRFEMKSNSIMLNGLLYLQEICCHPTLLNKEYNFNKCASSVKLELLMNLLESLYEAGHKVVVFSRFTKMLKIIEKRVISDHFNCFYLDGKTNNRIDVVEQFESSQNGIFLISLKAGGTGINLVSADTAIIYDPWWNPAIEKQAEDRIYRIGQKNNVMIYRLITKDTIEEKIQKLQGEKKDLYSKVLDGHEMPVSITAEVMEKLILD